MTFPPLLRSLLKGWLFSFFAFSLLAFLVVGQFAWRTSLPWIDALHIAARDWGLWALLTPLIFFKYANFLYSDGTLHEHNLLLQTAKFYGMEYRQLFYQSKVLLADGR